MFWIVGIRNEIRMDIHGLQWIVFDGVWASRSSWFDGIENAIFYDLTGLWPCIVGWIAPSFDQDR